MAVAEAEILVLSGASAGKTLRVRESVRIGSAPDCHLVLPDAGVAPVHMTIAAEGNAYVLWASDVVYVEGAPARVAELATICKVDVAGTTLLFEIKGGAYIGRPTIREAAAGAPAFAPDELVFEAVKLGAQRSGATVTRIDDDRVLIAGGKPPMRGPTFATAELCSLADHSSREIALDVPRLCGAAAALSDGRVVLAGGETEAAELFDPRIEGMLPIAPLHVPRTVVSAITLADDRVLVLGGNSGMAGEVYDPAGNRWYPLTGPAFSYASAVALSPTALFVVAQRGGPPPRPADQYFVLDLTSWQFIPVGPSAAPRNATKVVGLPGGRALVIGGLAEGQWRSEVDQFDLASGQMAPVGALLAQRSDFAATALASGRALVIGGGSLGAGLYSAELFDPDAGRWQPLPALRKGINPLGAVARGDGSAFVAGVGGVFVTRRL
jgi:hypothetical protein